MPNLPRIACDTCFFITMFNREPGFELCRAVVEDARQGRIEIIVSCCCVAECVRPGPGLPIFADGSDPVEAFFENEYFKKVNVDWFVALRARQLQELTASADPKARALRPYDAVHLATAMLAPAEMFFTYDKALLKFDGHQSLAGLKVCCPSRPWEPQLVLEEDGSGARSQP